MGRKRSPGTGNLIEHAPGRWFIRVDHGTDPATGKRDRRSLIFRGTRVAAQQKLNELLSQRDAGLAPAPEKVLLADWLEQWLARHSAEGHIGARSHERYAGIISQHIIPAIGDMTLQSLRPQHVADLKARWLQKLKPATVHKHMVILRRALEEAVTANVIARNPALSVPSPSVVRNREEQRALNESEIALLLRAAAGGRFDVPVRVTLATGLREGELLALKWKDVDIDDGIINVRGTKTSKSRRRIELSAAIVSLLKSHRQEQRRRRMRLRNRWQEHELVFPSMVGTPWLRRAFYRDYRKIVDGSGIEDPAAVKWHTLRHTAASQWILHGADIFTVSRRLGHASAAFTMDTYAHLLKGQQRVAAEALDHLLAT